MTPCILHGGYITPFGYGRQSHNNKSVTSHRLAYCKAHGLELSDIEGQVVRHKCDVRACVNPDHLELGTQLDNIHDMIGRGRRVIAVGAQLPQSKLTVEDVVLIRKMLADGEKQAYLAKKFNTPQSNISAIKHRKAWAYVP